MGDSKTEPTKQLEKDPEIPWKRLVESNIESLVTIKTRSRFTSSEHASYLNHPTDFGETMQRTKREIDLDMGDSHEKAKRHGQLKFKEAFPSVNKIAKQKGLEKERPKSGDQVYFEGCNLFDNFFQTDRLNLCNKDKTPAPDKASDFDRNPRDDQKQENYSITLLEASKLTKLKSASENPTVNPPSIPCDVTSSYVDSGIGQKSATDTTSGSLTRLNQSVSGHMDEDISADYINESTILQNEEAITIDKRSEDDLATITFSTGCEKAKDSQNEGHKPIISTTHNEVLQLATHTLIKEGHAVDGCEDTQDTALDTKAQDVELGGDSAVHTGSSCILKSRNSEIRFARSISETDDQVNKYASTSGTDNTRSRVSECSSPEESCESIPVSNIAPRHLHSDPSLELAWHSDPSKSQINGEACGGDHELPSRQKRESDCEICTSRDGQTKTEKGTSLGQPSETLDEVTFCSEEVKVISSSPCSVTSDSDESNCATKNIIAGTETTPILTTAMAILNSTETNENDGSGVKRELGEGFGICPPMLQTDSISQSESSPLTSHPPVDSTVLRPVTQLTKNSPSPLEPVIERKIESVVETTECYLENVDAVDVFTPNIYEKSTSDVQSERELSVAEPAESFMLSDSEDLSALYELLDRENFTLSASEQSRQEYFVHVHGGHAKEESMLLGSDLHENIQEGLLQLKDEIKNLVPTAMSHRNKNNGMQDPDCEQQRNVLTSRRPICSNIECHEGVPFCVQDAGFLDVSLVSKESLSAVNALGAATATSADDLRFPLIVGGVWGDDDARFDYKCATSKKLTCKLNVSECIKTEDSDRHRKDEAACDQNASLNKVHATELVSAAAHGTQLELMPSTCEDSFFEEGEVEQRKIAPLVVSEENIVTGSKKDSEDSFAQLVTFSENTGSFVSDSEWCLHNEADDNLKRVRDHEEQIRSPFISFEPPATCISEELATFLDTDDGDKAGILPVQEEEVKAYTSGKCEEVENASEGNKIVCPRDEPVTPDTTQVKQAPRRLEKKPSTPWERLVEANIESIFNVKTYPFTTGRFPKYIDTAVAENNVAQSASNLSGVISEVLPLTSSADGKNITPTSDLTFTTNHSLLLNNVDYNGPQIEKWPFACEDHSFTRSEGNETRSETDAKCSLDTEEMLPEIEVSDQTESSFLDSLCERCEGLAPEPGECESNVTDWIFTSPNAWATDVASFTGLDETDTRRISTKDTYDEASVCAEETARAGAGVDHLQPFLCEANLTSVKCIEELNACSLLDHMHVHVNENQAGDKTTPSIVQTENSSHECFTSKQNSLEKCTSKTGALKIISEGPGLAIQECAKRDRSHTLRSASEENGSADFPNACDAEDATLVYKLDHLHECSSHEKPHTLELCKENLYDHGRAQPESGYTLQDFGSRRAIDFKVRDSHPREGCARDDGTEVLKHYSQKSAAFLDHSGFPCDENVRFLERYERDCISAVNRPTPAGTVPTNILTREIICADSTVNRRNGFSLFEANCKETSSSRKNGVNIFETQGTPTKKTPERKTKVSGGKKLNPSLDFYSAVNFSDANRKNIWLGPKDACLTVYRTNTLEPKSTFGLVSESDCLTHQENYSDSSHLPENIQTSTSLIRRETQNLEVETRRRTLNSKESEVRGGLCSLVDVVNDYTNVSAITVLPPAPLDSLTEHNTIADIREIKSEKENISPVDPSPRHEKTPPTGGLLSQGLAVLSNLIKSLFGPSSSSSTGRSPSSTQESQEQSPPLRFREPPDVRSLRDRDGLDVYVVESEDSARGRRVRGATRLARCRRQRWRGAAGKHPQSVSGGRRARRSGDQHSASATTMAAAGPEIRSRKPASARRLEFREGASIDSSSPGTVRESSGFQHRPVIGDRGSTVQDTISMSTSPSSRRVALTINANMAPNDLGLSEFFLSSETRAKQAPGRLKTLTLKELVHAKDAIQTNENLLYLQEVKPLACVESTDCSPDEETDEDEGESSACYLTDAESCESLKYSLECLLEVLVQRGKIEQAFVADFEGEVLARTGGCWEIARRDVLTLDRSLTSAYPGIISLDVLAERFTCVPHVHTHRSLTGSSENHVLTAVRGARAIVAGLSPRSVPGSCIREVEELARVLTQRGL